MKKTTQIILLFVAITLGCLNTTQAAFPIKKAPTNTEATVEATSAPVAAQQTISEASNAEIKAIATTKGGGGKSKIIAAVLAFFVGWTGAHSFYMGNKKKGLIQLLLGVGGWLLSIIGIGAAAATATGGVAILSLIGSIALLAAGIWAFVDFIRILIGNLEPESGFND